MAGLTGWMILLPLTMVITVVVTSELENRKWGDPKNCSIYYVFQKHTCDSGLWFNFITQKCDKRAEVDCTCNDEYSSQEDEQYGSHTWSTSSEESKSSSCSCSEDDSKNSYGYSKCDTDSGYPEHGNYSGYGGHGEGSKGSGSGGHGEGSKDSGYGGHGEGSKGSGYGGHDSGSDYGEHDNGSGSGVHGNGSGSGAHDNGSVSGGHDNSSGSGGQDNGSGSGGQDNGSGYGGHGEGSKDSGSGGYDTGGSSKDGSSQEDGPHEHHSHSQDDGYDTGHREHGSAEGTNKEQGIEKVDSILQMFKNKLAMKILTKGSIIIMMDITTKNIYYELQLKVLSFFIEMLNRVHPSIAVITCSVTAKLLIKPGYYATSALISIVKGVKQYGSAVNYTAAIEVYRQVQQDADANILWLIGSENSTEVTSEITEMKRHVVILCLALGNQRSTEWTRMCSRDEYGKPLCYQVKDASVIKIAQKYNSLTKNLARLPFGISESNE